MKTLAAWMLTLVFLGFMVPVVSVSADQPPEVAAKVIELKAGERGPKHVDQEDGSRITIEAKDVAKVKKDKGGDLFALAAYSYSRSCTVTKSTPSWRISQTSVWSFDFNSAWFNSGPYPVSLRSSWPFSWSNPASWNTNWDYQTLFTDGQGRLSTFNYLGAAIAQTTWRVYVGMDAWGNCWGGNYQP